MAAACSSEYVYGRVWEREKVGSVIFVDLSIHYKKITEDILSTTNLF